MPTRKMDLAAYRDSYSTEVGYCLDNGSLVSFGSSFHRLLEMYLDRLEDVDMPSKWGTISASEFILPKELL
jgi:hypothetical protein